MREMLPILKPMLLSSIYDEADDSVESICHHIESRSLISFILLTLDLELHEVMAQSHLQPKLAEEMWNSVRDPSSVYFVYPFLCGASLLKECGFIDLADLSKYPLQLWSREVIIGAFVSKDMRRRASQRYQRSLFADYQCTRRSISSHCRSYF